MAFNISEFNGKLANHGLAKDNLFIVSISPPLTLRAGMPPQDLTFFCNACQIPSLALGVSPVVRHGFGATESRPNELPLPDLTTTFMVDSNFRVKEFFHRWMQSIVNFDNSQGQNTEFNGMLPYEFSYHQNYVGTIQVAVYSFNSNEVVYVYEFGNAFPTSIGSVQTAWSNNNSFMTLDLAFAYDIYRVQGFGESIKTSRYETTSGFGGGLSQFIYSLGRIGNALDALGVDTPIQDFVNTYTTVSYALNSPLIAQTQQNALEQ